MGGHAGHASVRYGERDRSGGARNVAAGEYFGNRRLLLLVHPDEFSERSILQIAAKLFGNRPSHGPAKREDAGEFNRAAVGEFNGRALTEYPPDAPLLHRDAPPGQS